ncbi:MAG: acyl-CoA dehydrogenase family protein [Desulfobacterales bacterium]
MKKNLNQLFVYPKDWVSGEADEIAKSVRQWATKEVVSRRLEFLEAFETLFPRVRTRLALDIGCQGLMFPADSGGLGLNPETSATALIMILKEVGRADAGIGFIHAMEYALCALIATSSSRQSAVYEQLAPLFCRDQLNTATLILPSCAPSGEVLPLFAGRPIRASLNGANNSHTVSGRALRPLDLGKDAAVFAAVCADTDEQPGVAIVMGNAKGITREESLRKTGLEGCTNADVTFQSAPVFPECWIAGDAAVCSLYAWTNLFLGAVSIGAAMGCMEVADQWATERVIKGGCRLKDNPLCAAVLAEAYEETAVSWTLLHHLAHFLSNPGQWGAAGSAAMFTQAQMTGRRVQAGAMLAVNKMMELMASEGYAREGRMEKAWRDIKTIQSALCGAGADAPVRLDVARHVFDSRPQ